MAYENGLVNIEFIVTRRLFFFRGWSTCSIRRTAVSPLRMESMFFFIALKVAAFSRDSFDARFRGRRTHTGMYLWCLFFALSLAPSHISRPPSDKQPTTCRRCRSFILLHALTPLTNQLDFIFSVCFFFCFFIFYFFLSPATCPPSSAHAADQADAKRIYREMYILRHTRHNEIIHLRDVLMPAAFGDFRDLYLVWPVRRAGQARGRGALVCVAWWLLNCNSIDRAIRLANGIDDSLEWTKNDVTAPS